MSKILKYILFRTVLVIITLHTVIAHPHSDKLSDQKHLELHQKSNSLIGLIRLAFHESNDENLDHLVFIDSDDNASPNDTSIYPVVSLPNCSNPNVTTSKTNQIVKCHFTNFERLFFVKLNGLRGPPLFS